MQILILNLLTPIFRLRDRFLPLPSLSLIAVLEHDRERAEARGVAMAAAGHGA